MHHYIALDFGAESGRVILGTLNEGKLQLEEIHRFPTGALSIAGTLRWDVLRLFDEVRTGLVKVAKSGIPVDGISTDSWGVDYVLLQGKEPLLTAPYHYRDARTDGGFELAFAVVPKQEIYARTGVQFMTLNTLYQLHADVRDRPEILALADRFVLIGDYFNYLLSGRAVAEASLASTTQLYDPKARQWDLDLAEKLGIPAKLFPEVVPSATVLGPLLPGLIPDAGAASTFKATKIIASCSHDTAAAVAGTPGHGAEWAYLSCGTWSLLGIESAVPFLTPEALAENFTNEVGHGGSIRFLRNIVGLWVLQECRRAWVAAGITHSYAELCAQAAAPSVAPLRSLIHPASAAFLKPGAMPEKVADYCRATGQPVPATPAEIVRCVVDSLALLYAKTLDDLERVTGRNLVRLHAVGGGIQNTLLMQAAADASGRVVLAGPSEATAAGNILLQALALGHVASVPLLRQIVRDSFHLKSYQPGPATAAWQEARTRFAALPVLD